MAENNQTPPPERSRPSAFVSFLRWTLRLILIIVLGVLLGVGIFYGIPRLYRQAIQPMQNRITRLEEARSDQEQLNEQFRSRLSELADRLASLETRVDGNAQEVDALDTSVNRLRSTQSAHLSDFDTAQATASARLNAIDEALSSLESGLSNLEADLSQTNRQVENLEGTIEAEDRPVAILRRELQLVSAMELLTRSQMFLLVNNLGAAQEDIRAARDLLIEVRNLFPPRQAATIDNVVERLNAALGNLPQRPVIASDDVEIAWQLLRAELPGQPEPSFPSPRLPTTDVTPTPAGATAVATAVEPTPTPTP